MSSKIVLSIVMFFTLFAAVIGFKSCLNSKHDTKEVRSLAESRYDTTTHWMDDYGAEHAARTVAEGSLEDMKAVYGHDMDSAAHRLDIQAKQIEQLQKVVASIKGNITAPVTHSGDTQKASYHDPYTTANATIVHDTLRLDYDISAPLNLTQYWKRPWLLGKKTHYIDGYSLNPNVHISELQNLKIEAKEPGRFGIGPYVGISLRGPSIGIAFTYSLIRF